MFVKYTQMANVEKTFFLIIITTHVITGLHLSCHAVSVHGIVGLH